MDFRMHGATIKIVGRRLRAWFLSLLSRRILSWPLNLWKICVPFWEANVAEFQRGRILGKRLSENQGDGRISGGVLMKRVLKIGGGLKGLMLVLNMRLCCCRSCRTEVRQSIGTARVAMFIMSRLYQVKPLNAELNPICHLLALLGAHHILHVSRVRVNSNFVLQIPNIHHCRKDIHAGSHKAECFGFSPTVISVCITSVVILVRCSSLNSLVDS
jgi:hypothetical protein